MGEDDSFAKSVAETNPVVAWTSVVDAAHDPAHNSVDGLLGVNFLGGFLPNRRRATDRADRISFTIVTTTYWIALVLFHGAEP